jgi:endonuclease/exonuclease/phosphatase family metal-dependent hydrolase
VSTRVHRLLSLAVVLAAFALAPALLLTGCPQESSRPEAASVVDQRVDAASRELELRLMTFNIRFDYPPDGANGWPHRRAMVVGLIRAQRADFVGLQEALKSQLDDIGPPEPYARLGVGRSDGRDGGEHSPILYRKDRFAVGETGTFWLSPTPEVPGSTGWGNSNPRICTWARFSERTTGRALYVFNTHLDHESQLARARGIELIAARVAARSQPDPVFFMGDFNAGEDNAVVQYASGKRPRASEGTGEVAALTLMDTFRAVHPGDEVVGTAHAFTGDTHGPKIDYIFAPPAPATEVLESAILRDALDGRYPSDHFAVTTRLRLR